MRDLVRADAAAGAGAVLHHHRLPERLGHAGAHQARHDVGVAARSEWHDQAHRTLRERGEGGKRRQRQGRAQRLQQGTAN